MLHQSKLKDGHLAETISALRDEIKALRDDVVGEVRSLKDRVSRLEKFQYVTVGALAFLVTGLPAGVYFIRLIQDSP